MGCHRQFIAFTGAVQILLTLTMFIMTSFLLDYAVNDAIGIPLWGALITNCNCGTILANTTAFIVSILILALFSWSLSLSTDCNTLVVPFSTIVFAAILICFFSFLALVADCLAVCFKRSPKQQHQSSPQGPYAMEYGGSPPRGIPNQEPILQRVMVDLNQSQILTSNGVLRSPIEAPDYY